MQVAVQPFTIFQGGRHKPPDLDRLVASPFSQLKAPGPSLPHRVT